MWPGNPCKTGVQYCFIRRDSVLGKPQRDERSQGYLCEALTARSTLNVKIVAAFTCRHAGDEIFRSVAGKRCRQSREAWISVSIYSNVLVHDFTGSTPQQQFLVWVTPQQRWPHNSPCQTKVWAQTWRRCRVWGGRTTLVVETVLLSF